MQHFFIDLSNFFLYNGIKGKEVIIKVNERIREIRKALKMTQQEFADSLDTSRNNVAGWETGTRLPSATALALICTRHNVNKDFLYEGEGEMFKKLDAENELMAWAGKVLSEKDESFKKRFVKMLMALDEDEWEVLAKFMSTMVDEKKD